jgi:two-component system nitrogen regulation response regulator GlnG
LLARDEVIDAGTIEPLLAGEGAGTGPETAPDEATNLSAAFARWVADANPEPGKLYDEALAAFERPLFVHALKATGGNQLRAAQLLGINRNTLRKRLGELAIDPETTATRG